MLVITIITIITIIIIIIIINIVINSAWYFYLAMNLMPLKPDVHHYG